MLEAVDASPGHALRVAPCGVHPGHALRAVPCGVHPGHALRAAPCGFHHAPEMTMTVQCRVLGPTGRVLPCNDDWQKFLDGVDGGGSPLLLSVHVRPLLLGIESFLVLSYASARATEHTCWAQMETGSQEPAQSLGLNKRFKLPV